MNEKLKHGGLVGLITLLLIFGGNMLLTEDELNNAYICTYNEKWGVFYGGVSPTGKTAYPYIENKTNYRICRNGIWMDLRTYAETKGVDPLTLLQSSDLGSEPIIVAKQWECPTKKLPCVPI